MDAARARLTRLPRWTVPALAVVPVVGLAVFYAWPLATLLGRVVTGSSVADVLHAPGLGRVLWFTLWQAVVSTALTMVLGFAPAYVLARHRFRGRRFVLAVVTVPFMLPTVVVGAAFLALLPRGLHQSATAVIVAHVFFNVAVMVRLVGAMWSVIPTDLTAAARTLGASDAQVLRHVVLPLLRPALLAAGSVIFLFTFTSFGVAKVLGGTAHRTVEVEIARRATQLGDVDGAAVLSVLQLVVLGIVVWWSARWQRRAAVTFAPGRTSRTPRGRQRRRVAAVVAVTTTLMLLPIVAMVLRSFRPGGHWSLRAWRGLDGGELRPGVSLGVDALASLWVSMRFAVVAVLISVVAGGLAALAITTAQRHGRWLDAGLMLPLGTSAVTIGLGMLITFDTQPFDWRAAWWLVPLGHALVATPFVVRSLVPVLRAIPPDQRAAATTLGASPLRAWWEVEVRRLLRPLAGAAGFAAAVSLGEFGATTFLTRSGTESMPIAIDRLLARTGDIPRAQAFALATVLLALTATVVAVADREGSGARGR
ncbi:MAG: ABC transporter permease [Ilumatobacteraceae bacterium]